MNECLSENQLNQLASALHEGTSEVSKALASWIQTDSLVEIDSVEQLPLKNALEILGQASEVRCFATLEIKGWLQGQLILGFDDTSGLSLTDLILSRPLGTASEWGDVEKSSALETMNIIGSVYLNALSRHYSNGAHGNVELLPTPPSFFREFTESLLQAAFIDQAMASEWVLVAKTSFSIRGEKLTWTLLFIPSGESMRKLSQRNDRMGQEPN